VASTDVIARRVIVPFPARERGARHPGGVTQVPVPTSQYCVDGQHMLQPHTVVPVEHSGTQVLLMHCSPQGHMGMQLCAAHTPLMHACPAGHGPLQVPPQPFGSPQFLPVQTGTQVHMPDWQV
jgi:hypothetical protein